MKNMKIGDLFAIGAVLLLAVVCFLTFLPRGGGEAAVAQIYQNGQLLMTVALDRPDQFPVQGDYCNTVTVKDGAIAITASDCPGQDCIHSGSIRAPGSNLYAEISLQLFLSFSDLASKYILRSYRV